MKNDHTNDHPTTDDDELDPDIRATLQALGDDLPEPGEAGRRSLHTRLEAEMATERSPQPDHGIRRRWWVPTVAVAATVAVTFGVTMAVNAGDTDGTDSAAEPQSVQELLHQAADELESAGGEIVIPTEDQWLYRQAGARIGGSAEVLEVLDLWIAVSPDREEEPVPGLYYPIRFPDPAQVQQIYRDLPDNTADVVNQVYELSVEMPPDRGLQNAPPELLDHDWVSHLDAFRTIAELLYAGDPPPIVQAKLYRALAEIPGVIDEGLLDDAIADKFTDGQPAQFRVIGWDWDFDSIDWPDGMEYGVDWALSGRPQIAIDPETHHFRAQRWQNDKAMEGYRLAGLEVIFDTGFVDEENQLP